METNATVKYLPSKHPHFLYCFGMFLNHLQQVNKREHPQREREVVHQRPLFFVFFRLWK
jgi:hypothetical protein